MVKIENSKIEWGYVYFLKGIQDKSKSHGKIIYYVGCTRREMTKRLNEHVNGQSRFTSRLKDISLVYYFMVPVSNMFSVENYFKSHRYIVYSFVNKVAILDNQKKKFYKSKLVEKRFFKWCESRDIRVIESGDLNLRGMKNAKN